MNGYEQIISEDLKEQDEREFTIGDTLDIKTSIALVVITFLATQSADFLKTPLPSSLAHNPAIFGGVHNYRRSACTY